MNSTLSIHFSFHPLYLVFSVSVSVPSSWLKLSSVISSGSVSRDHSLIQSKQVVSNGVKRDRYIGQGTHTATTADVQRSSRVKSNPIHWVIPWEIEYVSDSLIDLIERRRKAGEHRFSNFETNLNCIELAGSWARTEFKCEREASEQIWGNGRVSHLSQPNWWHKWNWMLVMGIHGESKRFLLLRRLCPNFCSSEEGNFAYLVSCSVLDTIRG